MFRRHIFNFIIIFDINEDDSNWNGITNTNYRKYFCNLFENEIEKNKFSIIKLSRNFFIQFVIKN
jgi:hypothetical protein